MHKRLSVAVLLTVAVGASLLWVSPKVEAGALGSRVNMQPAPTNPSPSCPQPDRTRVINSLTLQERLDQGYPLPVNGKTDPQLDQIIHDRGKHFCHDTDVPRTIKSTSVAFHPNAESNNPIWAGNYADGGPSYTYVQSYWTESCYTSGSNDAFSTWVGIGGIGNNNLVQTGADGINSNTYGHYYEAWVQNYGTNYNVNVFGLKCGDHMLAEVGAGDCMYVADLSSGASSGWRCASPNANTGTAECVIERLAVGGGSLTPLSNFGNETLATCDVEESAGPSVGIGTVPHDYFNMYNGGTLLASTGPISGGNTYTMTWHNYQ